METRTIHAKRIHLQGMTERSVIIWPKHISEKTCLRLVNPRRTWLTTRRGDAVLLTHDGKKERHYVESIELYRVNPAEHIGKTVDSARAWLDKAEKTKS